MKKLFGLLIITVFLSPFFISSSVYSNGNTHAGKTGKVSARKNTKASKRAKKRTATNAKKRNVKIKKGTVNERVKSPRNVME